MRVGLLPVVLGSRQVRGRKEVWHAPRVLPGDRGAGGRQGATS